MSSSRLCIPTQFKEFIGKNPFCSFLGFFSNYLLVIFRFVMENFKEKCKVLFKSRNCLGCCPEPSLTVGHDKPPKDVRKRRGEIVEELSIADDFWRTTNHEMDLSQRCLLSLNTSNRTLDSHTNVGAITDSTDFTNHGLLQWSKIRQQWTAKKRIENKKRVREPSISWNATYESLLGTDKSFSQPIALSEMVGFLVDVWEQEGLYDR